MHIKNSRLEWLNFLNNFNFKYFLTVTFCKDSLNSDKDIERFIRIIHQTLFTKKFIKTKKLLGIAVVREQKKYLSERNHYHILIEERDDLNIIDLAKAICKASTKCDTIKTVSENFYEKILTYNKERSDENNTTIKLAEIPIQDRERTINYVLKQGQERNFKNVYIATEKNHNSYFPIVTG